MKSGLRNKFFAVHAIVLAVGVLLSASIYVRGRSVMDVTEFLVEQDLPALKSLSDLKADVIELEPILYEYYISGNRERFLARMKANTRQIEANLGAARKAFPQNAAVAGIEGRYAEIKSLAASLDRILSADHIDLLKAKALVGVVSRSCAQIVQDLDGTVKELQSRVSDRAQASHDQVIGIIGLVAFFSGMLFLVVLIAGRYLKAYLVGVAARKRAEARLVYQAYHDALTGLPNRHLFKERVAQALSRGLEHRHHALMLLNVDRLKQVNDSLGHVMGDRLLQAAAQRLATMLQGCEAMCAGSALYRLEGDLFAILMPVPALPDAPIRLAERVSACMNDPLRIDEREFFVTFSTGIAVHPSDGEDPVALVKNADSAMHAVKQRGGDGYQCYTQEMNAGALDRLELGYALRHALERDEFMLHYQPQLDIASGRIVGMEALIRWRHSGRGMVAPAEFIPLAEESGLIVPIGEWVLRTACAQARAWQSAGLATLTVAVNISARQFYSRDLPDVVERTLKETGLPPCNLELEVTESVAMRDVEFTIAALGTLEEIGVAVSIDDFGTGYSSLSYLKRFPISKLKMDRSFVCRLATDANDQAISRAIIALAHSLKLEVIAEGVETGRQLELLRQYGCDEMQGYLFSRPVTATEFTVLIMEDRRLNAAPPASAGEQAGAGSGPNLAIGAPIGDGPGPLPDAEARAGEADAGPRSSRLDVSAAVR